MALSRPSKDTDANRRFGRQANGSWHWGTDWGWGNGPEVYSMLAGVVIETADRGDYGRTVRILHGRDSLGRVVETRYCHLSPSVYVEKDDIVAAGEKIALMGDSGSLAKSVHLHSELYLDGVRVDELAHQDIQIQTPPPGTAESDDDMTAYILCVGAPSAKGSALEGHWATITPGAGFVDHGAGDAAFRRCEQTEALCNILGIPTKRITSCDVATFTQARTDFSVPTGAAAFPTSGTFQLIA